MKEQTTAPKRRPVAEAEADGMIEGRNAVIEALRAGTAIDKIYLAKGETDKTLGHIASKARAAGVVVVEADRRKLDAMSRTHAHQGVIALAAVREYVTVESILQTAAEQGRSAAAGDLRRDLRSPQSGRHPPYRRVRRGPRRHHPQAPQRGTDCHRGKDLRRCGQLYAGGAGGQHPLAAERPEKAGRLGVRHRRRRQPPPCITPT